MPRVDEDRSTRRASFMADERGQTFPFAVTLLFALFIVCAVAIDVGQAVNRRVFLQIVADAGAFTGATEMARGMNTIGDLNLWIQRAWGALTFATVGFTVTACPVSDLGVSGYRVFYGATNTMIQLVNIGYGIRARSEAERVTVYNAMDLFPGERLEMRETDLMNGIVSPRPAFRLVDLQEVADGTRPSAPALSGARKNPTWSCLNVKPPFVEPRSRRFGLWYEKRPGAPIAFVWVVKAPATRARLFDRFFGGRVIPQMTAVAAAKPVGGNIKEGKAEYVAKLIPVRQFKSFEWDRVARRLRQVLH